MKVELLFYTSGQGGPPREMTRELLHSEERQNLEDRYLEELCSGDKKPSDAKTMSQGYVFYLRRSLKWQWGVTYSEEEWGNMK